MFIDADNHAMYPDAWEYAVIDAISGHETPYVVWADDATGNYYQYILDANGHPQINPEQTGFLGQLKKRSANVDKQHGRNLCNT